MKLYIIGTYISSSPGTVGARGALKVGLIVSMTCTYSRCNTLQYAPGGNPVGILFTLSSLLTGTESDTGGPMGTLFLTASWSLNWSVCFIPQIFRFYFFSSALSPFIFIARISSFVNVGSSGLGIVLAIASSSLTLGDS